MFDPVFVDHDKAVAWALRAVTAVSQEQVAGANPRQLVDSPAGPQVNPGQLRGAPALPEAQTPRARQRGTLVCRVRSGTEFPRAGRPQRAQLRATQWGGVRHDDPVYAAFEPGAAGVNASQEPTADDVDLLGHSVIRLRLPARIQAVAQVRDRNRDPGRRKLIGILGSAGVLQPKGHPSFRWRLFRSWIARRRTMIGAFQ